MAESRKNPAAKPVEAKEPDAAPEATPSSNGNSKVKKEPKDPSLYHVYTTDDEGGTLNFLKDVTAKTAESAVSSVVGEDTKLVGKEIVVVPDRNLKTFKSEVETKTKVKVTAA